MSMPTLRRWRRRPTRPPLLKVIIETALLTDDEKVAACVLAHAHADFVKTSTGGRRRRGGRRAAHAHGCGGKMGVKASGGIRTAADALALAPRRNPHWRQRRVSIVQALAEGQPPSHRDKDSY